MGGGDTMIPSPRKSPKQPLPGIGPHDPLHGRQACPELNSFHPNLLTTLKQCLENQLLNMSCMESGEVIHLERIDSECSTAWLPQETNLQTL